MASRSADATAESTRATNMSPRVDLVGAGATFPYPLYARWFNEYATVSGVRINYRSTGSVNGLNELLAGTVDFGATEIPMTDAEMTAAGTRIEHLPTALGAVAITYNVPGVVRPLRVSGEVVAEILLGRIAMWNDPQLTALNPGIALPPDSIRVVYRSDGSGTSFILSDYLATVSPAWAAGPGRGRELQWPVGTGAAGNEGVAADVRRTAGALGYVEAVYARQNGLPIARVRNRAGRFVAPLAFEIASATLGIPASDTGFRVSLVDAADGNAYPISSFTWIVIAPQRLGETRVSQLAAFVRWALEDGGDIASTLGYVPLPAATADRVLARLHGLSAAPTATARATGTR